MGTLYTSVRRILSVDLRGDKQKKKKKKKKNVAKGGGGWTPWTPPPCVRAWHCSMGLPTED